MAKSRTDLNRRIEEILRHTSPPPAEASRTLLHFGRPVYAITVLLIYTDDHLASAGLRGAVHQDHMAHLRRMALVSLIEAFERFLKELASVCIDSLISDVGDDRFEEFSAKGGQLAFHLSAGSVGKALCESDTWLTDRTINERFRRLLKSPFGDNWENLFPEVNQQPGSEQARARTLAILWQVRHTITDNVGVITGPDAAKFRMVVKGPVDPDRVLRVTKRDIIHSDRFLSETTRSVNLRIGKGLETILDGLHRDNLALFDSQRMADRVSRQLGFSITVDGSVGVP